MTNHENNSKLIRIYDANSGELLKTYPIEELEKAYDFARDMESYGVDIEIKSPSLPQTLVHSLGFDTETVEAFQESLAHELDDHDVVEDDLDSESCCYGPMTNLKQ